MMSVNSTTPRFTKVREKYIYLTVLGLHTVFVTSLPKRVQQVTCLSQHGTFRDASQATASGVLCGEHMLHCQQSKQVTV